MRKPDFDKNIGAVLRKEAPAQPALFDFLLSLEAEAALSGVPLGATAEGSWLKRKILAYRNAGFDFVPLNAGGFHFTNGEHQSKDSRSMNDGALITDRKSFGKYKWNEPEDGCYDILDKELPDGMKWMAVMPCGVLENVTFLTGYENLCYMLADDRELAELIFKNVGERLVRYQKICSKYKNVGILMCNDDWGFNTGPLLAHSDLRELIFPYYKEVTATAHANGQYCTMHSCGNFEGIYDELYKVIGFDGKHSNEDLILPVEEAYRRYHKNIAILGGIDVDFLIRATPSEVEDRCKKMLKLSEKDGAYALGTGNSVANYVPLKNYFTLLKCANPELRINA